MFPDHWQKMMLEGIIIQQGPRKKTSIKWKNPHGQLVSEYGTQPTMWEIAAKVLIEFQSKIPQDSDLFALIL